MKKMIKFLSALVLLVTVFSCNNQPKEIKSDDEKFTFKEDKATYDGKPYSGTVLIDKNGNKGKIAFKDGLLDGKSEISDSQVNGIIEMKAGRFDGEMSFKHNTGLINISMKVKGDAFEYLKLDVSGVKYDPLLIIRPMELLNFRKFLFLYLNKNLEWQQILK